MPDTKTVKIERGRFSSYFQVTRAWLSAASALVSIDRTAAIRYIDDAIGELEKLRLALRQV